MNCLKKILLMLLFQAHEKIKKLIAWQKEIQRELSYQETPVEDVYQFGIFGKVR